MTIYTIDNQSHVDKAFTTADGFKIIAAGKKGEVTTTEPFAEEQIEALARDDVTVTLAKGQKDPLDHDDDGKKGGAAPAPAPKADEAKA